MAEPAPNKAAGREGVRVWDPAVGQIVLRDPETLLADYREGRVQLLADETYTLRGEDGSVWETPGNEVPLAVKKGLAFAGYEDRLRAEADTTGGAVAAALSSAAAAAPFGAGDALLSQVLTREQMDLMQLQREENPGAAAVGTVGGVGANLLLTGGLGAGGQVAGRAGTAALAARGAPATLARVAGGAVEGAVEGAAYGMGSALSEAALGNSDDVAQSLIAEAGGGAFLGGLFGGALRGLGEVGKWGAGKAQARTADFAEMIRREGGRDSTASLAAAVKRAASGKPVGDEHVELASRELSAALGPLVSRLKQPAKPQFGALTPAGAAGAIDETASETLRRALLTRGELDTAKVYRNLKRMGTEQGRPFDEALETVLGQLDGEPGVQQLLDVLTDASTVVTAKRAFAGQLGVESAAGDMPVWMARVAGYTAGSATGIPGAGGVSALAAGIAANRGFRPAHAQLARAQLARTLDDAAAAINTRARALVSSAPGRAAAAVGRAAARVPTSRLIPATAVMLSSDSPDERARAYAERVDEVRSLAASPGVFTERFEAATAHLETTAPQIHGQLAINAQRALGVLHDAIPTSYQPDALASKPRTPEHERVKFARIDAALQEPLRVMEPGATPAEHAAVKVAYPRLYESMRQAVARAAAESVDDLSWDVRRRLAMLWGAETHGAFNARHVAAIQAAMAPPPRGPGRPPKPAPHPAGTDEALLPPEQMETP